MGKVKIEILMEPFHIIRSVIMKLDNDKIQLFINQFLCTVDTVLLVVSRY